MILLTTDFGTGSPYVGQMKAAIFSVNASVSVVDLFHDLQPQNVKQTAWFLSRFAFSNPNAINVCVVDPGVGTDRKILLCKCNAGQFIGPDNGILSPFIGDAAADVIALDNATYWRSSISNTFHGRDIMAPTAAHLSLGVNSNQMGSPLSEDPVTVNFLPNQTDGCVQGEIMMIDCYGNAISNISYADLDSIPNNESLTFKCGGVETRELSKTYQPNKTDKPIALIGSSGWIEFAIPNGDFARSHSVEIGDPLTISW